MDHLQSWFGARSSAPLLQLLCEVFPQDHLVAGTPPVTSAIAYAPSPAPAPASASASASASAPASVPVLAPAAMLHPKSVSKWTFSAPRFVLEKSQDAVQAECDADEAGQSDISDSPPSKFKSLPHGPEDFASHESA